MIREAFARMLAGGAMALGYDAGESSRFRKDLGWGRRTPASEDSLISDGTGENVRLRGYDLRRNNGLVAGACERISLWCVGERGILPQAVTDDPEWNKAAENWWLNTYSPNCDSRGRLDMRALQWMACSMRPTHGGYYLETLQDGTVRPIECERIRQPRKTADRVGAYEGVAVDGGGRVVKYRVHARDKNGQFGTDHAERWVDARSVFPVVNPPWRIDQVREVPDLAPVVPSLCDLTEMNKYTLNTAKAHSSITAWMQKQGGGGNNSFPRGTTNPTVGSRQTFNFDWGQVLELFAGESINAFDSKTPNTMHIPYMEFQLRIIAPALGFPYEFFTLDFSKCDYSRMKGVLLLINKAARPWQAWVVDKLLRPLWNWRIAMAIRDGELPEAPMTDWNGLKISQWNRVDWQPPEEPWIDRQEAQQSDVLEYQLGIPLAPAHKRRGGNLEDNLRAKAREIKLQDRIAEEEGVPTDRLVQTQIPGQTPPVSSEPNGQEGAE